MAKAPIALPPFKKDGLRRAKAQKVSNKAMARASSLLNVTRQVSGAIGVAVLTTYLTQRVTGYGNDVAAALHKTPLTGIAAICAPLLHNGVDQMKSCVSQHIDPHGFNDAFTIATICCAICIVLALFVGRDKAIEAAKQADVKGETVEALQPSLVAE